MGPTIAPRSKIVSPATQASVVPSAATMITIVAYGLVSGAMPGISSRRSRGSDGGRRRRGTASGSAPRSSLGARLRTRWPQYGHSVTYMLTSEPQFLQTTNSSASLTDSRIPPGRARQEGLSVYAEVFSMISPTTSRRSWLAS